MRDDDYPPWAFAILVAALIVLAFAAAMVVPR